MKHLKLDRATWRDFTSLVAVAVAAVSVWLLVAERNDRADQICDITEADQRAEVRALGRTYDFLLDPKSKREAPGLYKAILAGLKQQEADAKRDNAPLFCDEDGVGEPEPDPKVPRRPAALRP